MRWFTHLASRCQHGVAVSYNGRRGVLHTLLDDEPLRTGRRAAEHPALVVEVAEHDEDAAPLLPEGVLDRYLDFVKGDVCGASCGRVGSLDLPRFDALAALYQDDSEPVLRLAADSEADGLQSDIRLPGARWADVLVGEARD